MALRRDKMALTTELPWTKIHTYAPPDDWDEFYISANMDSLVKVMVVRGCEVIIGLLELSDAWKSLGVGKVRYNITAADPECVRIIVGLFCEGNSIVRRRGVQEDEIMADYWEGEG